jgi:ribosome-binding factor A
MPSVRIQRVRELLKREIGEVLRRELPVHEVGLFSVNDVEVSGDLQTARVFVSVLGNADQQKRAPGVLGELRARIQGLIGRDLALRYTPVLTFVVDDSIAKGNRVLQIIDELEHEDPPPPEPRGDSSAAA